MNERIREFAEQSFIVTTDGNIGHVNEYMIEKFAELIVRECCAIVHKKTDESIRVVMAIEEHFGVEE